MALDTRGTLTKVDWEMFAAAAANSEARAMLICRVAGWLFASKTWRAFTDLYDAVDGGYPMGIEFTARPVVGGVFALLAVEGGFDESESGETQESQGSQEVLGSQGGHGVVDGGESWVDSVGEQLVMGDDL